VIQPRVQQNMIETLQRKYKLMTFSHKRRDFQNVALFKHNACLNRAMLFNSITLECLVSSTLLFIFSKTNSPGNISSEGRKKIVELRLK